MKNLTSVFLISLVGAIASQEISSAQILTRNHYFVGTLLTPFENSAYHANIDQYKGKMWAQATHDINSNNLRLKENSISRNGHGALGIGHGARLRQPKGMGIGYSELKTQNSELRTQDLPLPTQDSELRTQDSALIISPSAGTVLDLPATTIVVQYPTGSQIQLLVNGKPVDPALIGQTETDPNTGTTTQTWYGVPLNEGENIIEARQQAGASQNSSMPATKISIFVRGIPAQLKIQTLEARIPADSRSTATVTGQILDSAGNPTNRDATITLATSSGKFISVDADPDQPGYQVKTSNGEFSATLQSSLQAGIVRIRAGTPNLNAPADIPNPQLEAFTQIEFETNLRPNLLTGVIDFRFGRRGTDFWDSFSNFLPADGDNNYQLNARGAAFTTGTLGNWLFTGAYNSARNLNDTCNGFDRRLFQDLQFYEQQYPTYGDNCSRETVAPSRDSVYLRFEHSPLIEGAQPDYFMWGDYALSEFSTPSQQFTGITRSLHGFKGNYNLGNLQITGFYSQDVEGFQRDSIIPDGTSGFYFLSRRLVIPGSEDVFLEVEELDRPGTVLYRQQLTRSSDYEIDYDRGTLLFRRPILRVNADPTGTILVRRIISTYQYDSQDNSTSILGSHLQYNISRDFNRPSWIGATYLREDRGVRDFELYGGDILLSFGNNSRLVGEYAHSRNDSDILGNVSGSAYRLELNGGIGRRGVSRGVEAERERVGEEEIGRVGEEETLNPQLPAEIPNYPLPITNFQSLLNYRLYYRSTDTGFNNNATTSFVAGQSRYGAQLSAGITRSTLLRFQYDHEKNQGIAPRPLTSYADLFEPRLESIPGSQVDNSLTTLSAGVLQRIGTNASLEFDWINRHREDNRPTNPLETTSSQLRSRLSYRIANNLTFRAQNELNLASEQDIIYPDRTILALDWAAYPGITLRLSHIFFNGGQFENNSITSLDFLGDYKLGEDTALTGRFGVVNAQAMTGAVGIRQGWTIAPGLRVEGSYEHIFGDLFGRTGTGVQFAQPYAYGQGASALGVRGGDSYSVGIQYNNDTDFQASARYEHRTSSAGGNTVISAAATGKISRAVTALLRYQQASSANQLLEELGDSINLRLGLAYRDPIDDKFNALFRYEYRSNPSIIPDSIFFDNSSSSNDHTFALEAIYAPNWRWEFYGKGAMRTSTSYLANDLAGTGTIYLTQLRSTYRLGYRWDAVGEVRWIGQPADDYSEIGWVLETGYYLTPNLRLAAGYVFGDVTDRDFDGSRSASGPYLGLTVKLNELFSGFGLQKPVPALEKEDKQANKIAQGKKFSNL
ncbi:Ig-like domain-containing protein [Microcoleus sp. FACHB-68]|uniref:Ig-like domain-containing protein n=1 Tax=Microcoleus sp. FACHB-68 TaxID=2692826 RepID=UPI0016853BD4|nr:Ig-like domain-containing protein [Microcoleus sp. FACHB-68]MBD1936286.1 Ig-like domain-containing protein [Microcoleus sp. FACHB-68]